MRTKVFLFLLIILFSVALYGVETPYSLTFTGAAELALASSPDLRHAHASQKLKERAWTMGLRAYFPRISLDVSENDRLQQIGADSFIKNYGISVDQLLWDGGRTSMSRNLERFELGLASSALQRMASEITESALAAYRSVLSSRAILVIREEALVVLGEQRRILSEEVDLGLALPVDLARADISLSEAKIDLVSLRLDLEEMEKQFAQLLGLEFLPVLEEKVDINHPVVFPMAEAAGALARERNPDLVQARFSIVKKQAELKYISHSWLPNIRLTGGFGLTGQQYPLTRYNWSVGINVDFSGPWFQNRAGAQAGWEPPYDRTAMVQNSFSPLPDPAAGLNKHQALLALVLEREKYNAAFEQIGRLTVRTVEKCSLADQKRLLALEAVSLAAERCRIDELRLGLGQITRLNLMESFIEYMQKEIAVVEAAVYLLETTRELERILDFRPGELAAFAAVYPEENL
ncbi:MAG: TolC family protein [Treponema sp.]|nr:TolC family protein [Treponema sp.]